MPFGYLEFSRAIGREPCPHMRTRAAAGGGGRPAPALGSGSGPSLGSGSLPGLVLFESGLTGMGYAKHTRSDIRIRTGPPTDQLDSQQLRLLGQTIATVQTEPLQPFVGFEPVGPSWSAINSAPNSQLKHTNTKNENSLSLSLSLCVLNWK